MTLLSLEAPQVVSSDCRGRNVGVISFDDCGIAPRRPICLSDTGVSSVDAGVLSENDVTTAQRGGRWDTLVAPVVSGLRALSSLPLSATRVHRLCLAVACVALVMPCVAPSIGQETLFIQDENGNGTPDGYEDLNGNGRLDGYDGRGPQAGGMEVECLTTARPEVCLAYFQFTCRFYGFQMACGLAAMGRTCSDEMAPECRDYRNVLQANKDCYFGSVAACAWVSPVLRQ